MTFENKYLHRIFCDKKKHFESCQCYETDCTVIPKGITANFSINKTINKTNK